MTTTINVEGICEAQFVGVRDAFVQNFTALDEIGASISISLHGKTVVDLWAGYADKDCTQPWQRDTGEP